MKQKMGGIILTIDTVNLNFDKLWVLLIKEMNGISMALQIPHLNVTIYCARMIHDYSFNETIETDD